MQQAFGEENVYWVWGVKPKVRRSLGSTRSRREDII